MLIKRFARRIANGLTCMAVAGAASAGPLALQGAGATFPHPVYASWAAAYQKASGIEVGYDAVGSGAGVARMAQGGIDFGATDIPLSDTELRRLDAVQFPTVIGAVVPIVNLVGIHAGQLKLSGSVLADIYLGKITRWNAPDIAALNPGLSLPSSRITVVHRADASGTTWLWSEFLARSNPAWRAAAGVGQTVAWPTGVDAIGNDGVAASVQRTRAAIGYVEHAYARRHHLAGAALRNRDGAIVQASRASFDAAVRQARWQVESDLRQSLIDLPGSATWPLVSASFVLLPAHPARPERLRETLRFFDWTLSHGQPLAEELDYVPLPEAAAGLVRRAWKDQATAAR